MALVIEAIQAARLRLRDTATGKTIVQDVEAGGEWVCVEPAPAEAAADAEVKPAAEAAPKAKPAEAKDAKAEAKDAKAEAKDAKAEKPAEAKPAPEAKVKAAAAAKTKAAAKPATPKTPPKKPKVKKRDLSDPKVLARFEKEVLAAVRGGARTVKAIGNRLGADPKDDAQLVPIVAALQKHIDAGLIVQRGTGAKATYHKADAPAPTPEGEAPAPAKVDVLPPREVELLWSRKVVDGRAMKSAPFEGGQFFLTRRLGGSDKLTYEKGETLHEYGCGAPEKMQALAENLARAGVPSPELWIAQGGNIEACARITRMEGVELEWREKIDGSSQICIATSGDGEFRMAQNDNGSFILAFIRKGDPDVGGLGCGTREALVARALDIAGQIAGPAIEESAPSEGAAESPAPQEVDEDLRPDAAKDDAIMDAFERSVEKLRRK